MSTRAEVDQQMDFQKLHYCSKFWLQVKFLRHSDWSRGIKKINERFNQILAHSRRRHYYSIISPDDCVGSFAS